jgi:hypothetical protein
MSRGISEAGVSRSFTSESERTKSSLRAFVSGIVVADEKEQKKMSLSNSGREKTNLKRAEIAQKILKYLSALDNDGLLIAEKMIKPVFGLNFEEEASPADGKSSEKVLEDFDEILTRISLDENDKFDSKRAESLIKIMRSLLEVNLKQLLLTANVLKAVYQSQ